MAITAVELARETGNPVEAWKKALTKVGAADKGCPRSAFFGLCSEGFVTEIPPGKYTRSKKNKGYAVKAVSILRSNPGRGYTPSELWLEVTGGDVKHNGQMDVVLALWTEGYIKG